MPPAWHRTPSTPLFEWVEANLANGWESTSQFRVPVRRDPDLRRWLETYLVPDSYRIPLRVDPERRAWFDAYEHARRIAAARDEWPWPNRD
jgi:hypothetical protein